jgi:hypothetical protein
LIPDGALITLNGDTGVIQLHDDDPQLLEQMLVR